MAEVRKTRRLAATLVVIALMLFAAGCELEEPKSPTFLPTPTPTPVFPSAPIDSGINENPCEALGQGLSRSAKSNLRYKTDLTFRHGMAELESARGMIGERSDRELSESLDLLLESIELDDTGAAGTAADAAVRRCNELGYRIYMAPSGFPVW